MGVQTRGFSEVSSPSAVTWVSGVELRLAVLQAPDLQLYKQLALFFMRFLFNVSQANLELFFLPQSSECWHHKHCHHTQVCIFLNHFYPCKEIMFGVALLYYIQPGDGQDRGRAFRQELQVWAGETGRGQGKGGCF